MRPVGASGQQFPRHFAAPAQGAGVERARLADYRAELRVGWLASRVKGPGWRNAGRSEVFPDRWPFQRGYNRPVSNERQLAMSLPLDRDRFLRRECPTCESEFKWFASPEGEGERPPEGGYFCPYCGVQAPAAAWYTKAQIEQARAIAYRDIAAPEIDKLKQSLAEISRASGGLISATLKSETPDQPQQLSEADDMRRVDFSCHPNEPLKVRENWDKPIRCLICGAAAE